MRLLCLGAWLTWMCLTIKLLVSRPLVSALDSAFLSSEDRNSADLTGQRARETPNCLPVFITPGQHFPSFWYMLYVCAFSPSSNTVFPLLVIYGRTLRSTASAASIPPHGDGFLVVEDIVEVGEGAGELPAVDGLRRLAGVLEGDAEVGAARARRFGGLEVCRCVSDL